jgi:D-threo-aldose 1-dehydrogenase
VLTRRLGTTGASVTEVGYGAAPLGNLYSGVSDTEADTAVQAAWDAGIRYFDTAPHYGLGLSERRLGAALRARPRDQLVLSTKVGRLLVPAPGGEQERDLAAGFDVPADLRRHWDFTRDGVLRSIEASLDRLGLDRIDVAYVHDADDHEREAQEGALPALVELREQGVLRAVGVGMNQSAMPARFVERFDLDVVLLAGRYNLLDQSALDDLLPAAVRRGTSVVVGGVFASGILARDWPPDDATHDYGPASAEVLRRARRMAQLCREHGTTLPAAAVQFVLAHPAVASALLGMRSAAEVQRNAGLLEAGVPRDLWAALQEEGLVRADAPVPTGLAA